MAGKTKLNNAILILENALKNNLSQTESAKRLGIYNPIRAVKSKYSNKNDPEYKKFIKLYDNFSGNKNNNSETIVDDSDLLTKDDTVTEESIKIKDEWRNKQIDYRGNAIIKTLDQLLSETKVDLDLWKVDRHVINKWDTTIGNGGDAYISQNFQVKVWLSQIRSEEEQNAWNKFLEDIKKSAPDLSYLNKSKTSKIKKYSLELSLADLHVGKLADLEETGDKYNTKIAIERYNNAINNLLEHIIYYKDQIEEIVLPIGNDFLNIDNVHGSTTNFTPQSVDSRWQKIFAKGKDLLIENINKLSAIAPVKVIVVSGNHDYMSMVHLGFVIEAYYHNTKTVTVDNSPTQRKYYQYGTNLIGFTHGNEEKHQD